MGFVHPDHLPMRDHRPRYELIFQLENLVGIKDLVEQSIDGLDYYSAIGYSGNSCSALIIHYHGFPENSFSVNTPHDASDVEADELFHEIQMELEKLKIG